MYIIQYIGVCIGQVDIHKFLSRSWRGLRPNDHFPHDTGTDVSHDDVIKWKHFPRYWPFVRGIPRSPVNSPHKGQWRRALMFTLICARINGCVNNREAGDLRRYRPHYDVIVMVLVKFSSLARGEVVEKTTTSVSTCNENFVKMTFSFQC